MNSTQALKDAVSQIRQLLDVMREVDRKNPKELRQIAREHEIEIDPEVESETGISASISDAIDSRINSVIWNLAKDLGISFDDAAQKVNKALGF